MRSLFLLALIAAALCFDIVLRRNQERSLMWPVSPAQHLLIDCQTYGSTEHYFILRVSAIGVDKDQPLLERLIEKGRNRLQLTVPHPSNIMGFNHYVVTIRCQSHYHEDDFVWNLVALQLHSNFDHILEKNSDPKLSDDQKKYSEIAERAEEILRLAEEHATVQTYQRGEEDIADQNMESLNSTIVWYTILEVLAILLTIVVEMFCLKSFLHRHKVI